MKKIYLLITIIFSTVSVTYGQSSGITSSNAIHFDGTNDYLQTQTMPTPTAQYTVMAWIRLEDTPTRTISGWGSSTVSTGWVFRVQNQRLWSNPGNIPITGNTILPLNTWIHVAFTVNNNSFKFYVNGVLDGSFIKTPYPATGLNIFTVGTMFYGGSSYFPFKGKMDEYSLWNTELTEATIADYAQNSIIGNETGLVLNYNFNQGIAESDNTAITTISDVTTNSYSADINNMALSGVTSNFVIWDFALSINEFNYNNSVSIYPNPSNSFIKVKGLTNVENYILYNNLGQEIKKETISENEKIDIRNLNNGIYFLKFNNGETIKFIKE